MKTEYIPRKEISESDLLAFTTPRPKAFPVKIESGGYCGGFMLDKGTDLIFDTSKPFYLSPGIHTFDPSRVARSFFEFNVGSTGDVANVSNPIAARSEGNVLTLNAVNVTVDPGRLVSGGGNPCILPSHRKSITETQTFTFVPGLPYQLGSGGSGPRSATIFDVRANGTAWGWSHSANGGPGRLTLNVGWLEVVPERSATYYLGEKGPFTTPQRIPVILGLATDLKCGNYFAPLIPEFGSGTRRRQKVNGNWFQWAVLWE